MNAGTKPGAGTPDGERGARRLELARGGVPGAEVARGALRGSFVSSVNGSEAVQKVAARRGDAAVLRQLFGGLGVSIVPFSAERTAALYAETRAHGLSQGDRACLALGLATGREVYTADGAWPELALHVRVTAIR